MGSCAGQFLAFDAVSGKILWEFDVTDEGGISFHGNPVLADSLIFFGTDAGSNGVGAVYALNRFSGRLLWKSPEHLGIASDFSTDGDSLIYAVTLDDSLLALNMNNGKQIWGYYTGWQTSGEDDYDLSIRIPKVVSSPRYQDGRVIFDGRDSSIQCFSSKSGQLVWSHALGCIETSSLQLYKNRVLIATSDYFLQFYELGSGKIVDSIRLPYLALGGMALKDSSLVFLAGYEDNRPKELVSLNLGTDSVEWVASLKSNDSNEYWYVPRVHIWNNEVVVGSTGGKVVAFNLNDGKTNWVYQLPKPIRGIGSSESMLYVGTFSGGLYAFSKSTE